MPANNQSPAREHPAVRAARKIAHRFVGIVESPSRRSSWWRVDLKGNSTYTPYYGAQWEKANDVCENLRSVVADAVMESLCAYADRDARVLKALEACAKVMQATITRDAYLDTGFEFPGYGGQTFFEIAKQAEAAIAELRGEGLRQQKKRTRFMSCWSRLARGSVTVRHLFSRRPVKSLRSTAFRESSASAESSIAQMASGTSLATPRMRRRSA